MPACCGSQDCCSQCPWPHRRPFSTHASAWDSWTLIGKSGSVFCGITAPFSWILVCTRFCCALQESVSPVLWSFCNQIPLAFKVKFLWGFSVPLLDPQVGKSVVGLRIFTTVWELLQYNCSPVCGLSAGWLYGGAKPLPRGLLAHTVPPRSAAARAPVPTAGHCWPMPPQETVIHSKAGLTLFLVEVTAPFPGSWRTQICLHPPSISSRSEIWF